MSLRRVRLLVIFVSVWFLAAVLPSLRFAPGNWSVPEPVKEIREDVSPGLKVLLEIIGIGLIVSGIILGVLVIVFIWRRRRKRREDDSSIQREDPPVTWAVYAVIVLLFASFGGLVWLSWRHADIFESLMGPQRSAETAQVRGQHPPAPKISAPETKRPEAHTASSSRWRVPLVSILLIVLGVVLWRIFRVKPLKEGLEAPQVIQIASKAVKELERGGEPSDIVLRCYRDMCKILGRKVTASRNLTAREFTQLLGQTGIHEREVARLTDLFERVRYGHHLSEAKERAEAVALLGTIEEKYGGPSNET